MSGGGGGNILLEALSKVINDTNLYTQLEHQLHVEDQKRRELIKAKQELRTQSIGDKTDVSVIIGALDKVKESVLDLMTLVLDHSESTSGAYKKICNASATYSKVVQDVVTQLNPEAKLHFDLIRAKEVEVETLDLVRNLESDPDNPQQTQLLETYRLLEQRTNYILELQRCLSAPVFVMPEPGALVIPPLYRQAQERQEQERKQLEQRKQKRQQKPQEEQRQGVNFKTTVTTTSSTHTFVGTPTTSTSSKKRRLDDDNVVEDDQDKNKRRPRRQHQPPPVIDLT
jgi:hypothetical protein